MNTADITLAGLFLEGLLSFFTPCVLPLIPLYVGYISAGLNPEDKNHRLKVFLRTLCFVLGICTVFFIAGLGSEFLKNLMNRYTIQFLLFGGTVLLLFGLNSLGVIQIPFLMQDHRIASFTRGSGSYLQAYLLGFFFSFAWSPCIGPLLASAMVASASAGNALYFLAYVLGFILPFIALGLFTDQVLLWLKDHRSIVKYTGILGGAVVCLMGIYMISQGNQRITALEKAASSAAAAASQEVREEASGPSEEAASSPEASGIAAGEGSCDAERYNFTLYDSQGNRHTLTDYVGKPLILNFFGTWCYYCNLELPHLEETSHRDDVTVLLIAAPNLGSEGSEEMIAEFMKEQGYTMTVLYDKDYSVTQTYGVSSYPTTFIMKPDGNYLGYVPGYINDEMLDKTIEDAKSGS